MQPYNMSKFYEISGAALLYARYSFLKSMSPRQIDLQQLCASHLTSSRPLPALSQFPLYSDPAQ